MPIIKSAKKALKQNARNKSRNDHYKALYREARKTFEKAIKEKNLEAAKDIFLNRKEEKEVILKDWKKVKKMVNVKSGLQSIIDKLVKKNILHKNNASRKKSSFVKMLKAIS